MSDSARPAELPADMARAVEALGSRVKVLALLSLANDGRATAVELAERLNISRELVRRHILPLGRLGILDVDPPRSQTEVRRRCFSVNRAALRAAVTSMEALLVDADGH